MHGRALSGDDMATRRKGKARKNVAKKAARRADVAGNAASAVGDHGKRKPIIDVTRKVAYLAQAFNRDADLLLEEIYEKFRGETAERLKTEDPALTYNTKVRARLAKILSDGLKFECKMTWWPQPYDTFVQSVQASIRASVKTLSIDLGEQLSPFTAEEVKQLTGTYRAYRQSFSNRPEIAREWLTIEAIPQMATHLECRMWCHPSGSKDDGNGNVEDFSGKMVKFNDCYFITLALNNAFPDVTGAAAPRVTPRLRTIMFAIDPIDVSVQFGIASGRSMHLQAPVAARMVIHKVEPRANRMPDLSLVDRVKIVDIASRTDDPLLQRYEKLIDNHLDEKHHVLTATLPRKRAFQAS